MASNLFLDLVQYLHEPLGAARSIRLISLHPGVDLEAIQISLSPVSVDSSKNYEALSYAWDDQKPSVSIRCNSQGLLITRNAFDAMHELRLPNEERHLWIDQICINQNDLVERANQIALMAGIYSNAQNVIVWLGKADQHTATAFSLIHKLTYLYRCEPKTHEIFYVASVKNVKEAVAVHCSDSSDKIRSAVSALPAANSDECRSLIALLRRSWFGRLWVFQEVVLGTNQTQVRCGSWSCLIRELNDAIRTFDNCGYDQILTYGDGAWLGDYIVNTIGNLRQSRLAGVDKFTLDLLLSCTKQLTCYHPLDRVYAVLGVCNQKYLSHISIDYSLSVADVFGAVVRAALLVDRSLATLGHIQRFENPENDLPSWIPDWRESRSAYGVTLGFRAIGGTRFYNTSDNRPIELLPTINARHLGLRGARFRRITRFANERISLRNANSPRHDMEYGYTAWSEMYRAEAARLDLPNSCFRARGYGVDLVDDILGYGDATMSAVEKTKMLPAVALRRTLTADLYPRPHGSRGEKWRWQNAFPCCHEWARGGASHMSKVPPPPEMLQEHDSYVDRATRSRTLFVAGDEPNDAYLCLASVDVRVGDWICVLWGGDVPFVLRERPPSQEKAENESSTKEEENRWEFICECYVEGIMDGEYLQEFWDPAEETFILD